MIVSSGRYFSRNELKCKCGCNTVAMDKSFMDRLDALRWRYNNPIYLNSAYRCPEHNKRVGGVPDSAHVRGRAVDIRIYGEHAYNLMRHIHELGFTGIGIKQHGVHNERYIHLDDTEGDTRPWCWSYT